MKTSQLSENLQGSAIIKMAGEIKSLQAKGDKIYNLTIGDFDSSIFPIPTELKNNIIDAYQNDLTNYPAGNGELALRKSVSDYIANELQLHYSENEILISAGARPLIYAFYQTVLDINDTVLYPVPSWNNDAYTYLARCNSIVIETKAENKFMPTAAEIEPFIKEINLIAACSPLNPTGTTFQRDELEKICNLIITENNRRNELNIKPIYFLYDQIYWRLTYGDMVHYNPVSLHPEMQKYTLLIDGISKAFASTGVRVGWAFGPEDIIHKMKDILSHIGAWAPKPEQLATGKFLHETKAVKSYLDKMREELSFRLEEFYNEFKKLKEQGFPLDVIEPEAALYLTVRFDLVGRETVYGTVLTDIEQVNQFILKEAKVALVPFYAFGSPKNTDWFRLSVGTTSREDISIIMSQIKNMLTKIK